MDRDPFHLLNEAIDDEFEVQKSQLEGIQRAIAEAGHFATEA